MNFDTIETLKNECIRKHCGDDSLNLEHDLELFLSFLRQEKIEEWNDKEELVLFLTKSAIKFLITHDGKRAVNHFLRMASWKIMKGNFVKNKEITLLQEELGMFDRNSK